MIEKRELRAQSYLTHRPPSLYKVRYLLQEKSMAFGTKKRPLTGAAYSARAELFQNSYHVFNNNITRRSLPSK